MDALAWTAELLAESFEELSSLFERRQVNLYSPELWPADLCDLDARIAAHTDALVLAGKGALPLLRAALDKDDPPACQAAAYALSWIEPPALLEALGVLAGGPAAAVAAALCQGRGDRLAPELGAVALSETPWPAAIAAVALAWHGRAEPAVLRRFAELSAHDDPALRALAWRIAAVRPEVDAPLSTATLDRETSVVRTEALMAAAWRRERGLLPLLRERAAVPGPMRRECLQLLAILGTAEDYEIVAEASRLAALGPERFEAVAALGSMRLVEDLLEVMERGPAADAAAAGAAFSQLTGIDVPSLAPVSKELDVPDLDVPDAEIARQRWQQVCDRFGAAEGRWRRGRPVSADPAAVELASLDLRARRDACIRSTYHLARPNRLVELERLDPFAHDRLG